LNKPILSFRNLSIIFDSPDGPVPAVRDADFSVPQAGSVALVGESGCGKSVTALSAMGLVPQPGRIASGEVIFDGHDVTAMSPDALKKMRATDVAIVFQEPRSSLNPVFTVGFHLSEAIGKGAGLSKAQLAARSCELLREVGIADAERRLKAYPFELSGGLCQRVMISCAIARSPRLLIADEPTTALDVTVEAQIMGLLDRLRAERKMALLMVTHDLGLVAQHADEVVVMYAGYVVERAPVIKLFDRPLHPYTTALLAAMPTGAGGQMPTPIPGNVPDPSRLGAGCPFCPRCTLADEECARTLPLLEPYDVGRYVRCFKAGSHA
jgi:oligopeptide/dipeptide ABC transporter ATP-binding protein